MSLGLIGNIMYANVFPSDRRGASIVLRIFVGGKSICSSLFMTCKQCWTTTRNLRICSVFLFDTAYLVEVFKVPFRYWCDICTAKHSNLKLFGAIWRRKLRTGCLQVIKILIDDLLCIDAYKFYVSYCPLRRNHMSGGGHHKGSTYSWQ